MAKLGRSHQRTVVENEQDGAEHSYDPLWQNARRLLDYLSDHELIRREMWSTPVGQFVLAKGTLIVLDVALLKAAWEKEAVRAVMLRGSSQDQPASSKAKRQQAAIESAESKILLELLTFLPHTIQAHLVGTNYTVWCTLNETSLIGRSSDLVLKHGAYVPGE